MAGIGLDDIVDSARAQSLTPWMPRLGWNLKGTDGSRGRKEVAVSIFDELKGKAGGLKDKAAELVGNNAGSIKGGIGKVGDFIDTKTGGKYSGQVDGLQAKASELIDRAPGNNNPGRAGGANPPA